MRRHSAELTKLVRKEKWRWEDVGAAMTRAGISYSTGRPWTARLLWTKASQARAQIEVERLRNLDQAAMSAGATPVAAVQQVAVRPVEAPQHAGGVHFASARIRSQLNQPVETTAPAPSGEKDAGAVRSRFLGSTPSKENE